MSNQWEQTSDGYKLKLDFLTIYVWETVKGCHFKITNSGAYRTVISDLPMMDFDTAKFQAIRSARGLLESELKTLNGLSKEL